LRNSKYNLPLSIDNEIRCCQRTVIIIKTINGGISIKACFEKRIKVGLYADVQIGKYAKKNK